MKTVTVRLPDDLHVRLRESAADDRRSLNAEILHLLEEGLAARDEYRNGPDAPCH